MKDLIYYEDRFFIRLQELFSEHAQKQILITERAEIYYFFMYGKYKLFIRKSRKKWRVCGQNFENINNYDLFEKIPILEMKQFYNVYYEDTELYNCIEFYNNLLLRSINYGMCLSAKPRDKRQIRKRIKS